MEQCGDDDLGVGPVEVRPDTLGAPPDLLCSARPPLRVNKEQRQQQQWLLTAQHHHTLYYTAHTGALVLMTGTLAGTRRGERWKGPRGE